MNKPPAKKESQKIIKESDSKKDLFDRTVGKNEERYRTIFENTGNATILIAEDTTILLANSTFAKLTGYTKEEIEGKISWTTFIVPEDLAMMKEYHARRRAAPDATPNTYEFRFIRRTGEIRDMLLTVDLVRGTQESVASCMDITDSKLAMKALSESEKRYRLLAENLTDVIWVLDPELKYVYISPSVTRLRGYTPEEAMKQTMDQVLTPDSYQKAVEIFTKEHAFERSGLKHGKEWTTNIELEMICRDGSTIWTEVKVNILYDDQGEPYSILGVTRDITERRKTEQALMKNEERYRTIFEYTATANIIVAEDTTILLANANFEKLTGYSRREIENKMSWTRFVAAEDLEEMKQRSALRRTDPGAALSSYEFRGIIRSGEIRNFITSVALIPGTRNSVASFIDITDRKKAEDALKQSEERFRDMARLLPETVFEADLKGKITFVNEPSFERFGFTRDDLETGLHLMDFLAPQERERARANFRKVIQGETLGLSEYLAQKKDGTRFPVMVHGSRVFKNGNPVGSRGFLVDISEKKAMEDQLLRAQKLEAIGTLAGGIAHDFNNLLMGILGNISLMLMHTDQDHPFHDRLTSMEEYIQRGSDLTRQLLGFARGGKYEVRTTNLGKFAIRSAEVFGRTRKEISIHHRKTEDLWYVDVDRGQMDQVLLNLFVNAWQAMPGGGNLYIAVENAELNEEDVAPFGVKAGRFVKLTVTDTGIGMDEATQSRIFEPFFSTKERGRGTGLGLASVYGIIKNHCGFIKVESKEGAGTSFIIYLPASDKKAEEELLRENQPDQGRETILLIDDEAMIVDVGAQMLEGLGYKVLTAGGGRQGVDVFERHKEIIDLVILDMIMPDLSGKETFEALQHRDPSVKVLLSSGYSLDSQAKDIMTEGCKGFIQKPFTMTELSRKIREMIEKR